MTHEGEERMLCSDGDSVYLPAIQESSDAESSESGAEEQDHEKEREDMQKKLHDFEAISQKLLAELSILEDEYKIEKSCREQAEVVATQMNKENKKLKRFSTQVIPMLCDLPGEIKNLINEEQEGSDTEVDTIDEYQQQIKDMQDTINNLLEEKKVSAIEMEELKNQMKCLNEQIDEERMERKCLFTSLVKNQKSLIKLKRVSMMVTQEFNVMMDDLEREQELRHQAEVFAHKMLREQQVAKRQSTILMQDMQPSVMLLKALEEVSVLTACLEETKEEFQTKIINLESQLAKKPTPEEFHLIENEFQTIKGEKLQLSEQLKEAEDKCKLLEEKVQDLEEKLKEAESLCRQQEETKVAPPLPPPPPPPPGPPPPKLHATNPEDAVTLIRQRRGMKLSTSDPVKNCNDVNADAVKEMMDRIKNGIVLRPARKDGQSKSAACNKRKSVINELQGLLANTMKKPVRKKSYKRISRKINDNELDCVLLRRRRIVDISLPVDVATDKSIEIQEQDKSKEAQEQDVLNPSEDQWATEKLPVLVKLRQKTSELQQSRRKVFESSNLPWQQ